MIRPVKLADSNVKFGTKADNDKKFDEPESRIKPNTLQTRIEQKFHKTTNAFLEYPIKGLRGDVNSDFYEFLTMGIVPYLAGSLMFMGIFNLLHDLMPKSQVFASSKGKKMGLGVVLYGVMKAISNDFVTRPVNWGTGVDIELPAEHVYTPFPKYPGDAPMPQIQQRKVYDSREFFRKDLINKDQENYGKKYYNNIAKKLGLGEDLNDSVTETTPIIQSIVSMTKTAKSLSSYCWAGLGVCVALQDCWDDFFKAVSDRKRHIPKSDESFTTKMANRMKIFGQNAVNLSKVFGTTFVDAWKSLWKGAPDTAGFRKHAGKVAILSTLALTIGSTYNVIHRAKSMGKLVNKDIMNNEKESTVI